MTSLLRGNVVSKKSMFHFFLCAVDFYARNFKFKFNTIEEEFQFYLKRIQIFKESLISSELSNSSDSEIRAYIEENWDFAIIPFSEDGLLLTSDCPSIWLGSKHNKNELKGVLLPITPKYCFIGVHRDYYKLNIQIGSMEDSHTINIYEIENCINSVYFCDEIPEDNISFIQRRMKAREPYNQSSEGWCLELCDYDMGPNLTFIKVA